MQFTYYVRPETVEEATALLTEDGARLLAGGTDLLPRLRAGTACCKTLVDIGRLDALRTVRQEAGALHLGAILRLSHLQKMELPGALAVIAGAAGHVSSIQVRNRATLGGNTCNASPSADTVPALLVSDARALLTGSRGVREMPLADFLLGPGKTALERGELLTGFSMPAPPERAGAAYYKYAIRGDSDIAIVGAAARLTLDCRGGIADARLALAAVGPTALRCREAEAILRGEVPGEALFRTAAEQCARDVRPITDQRATEQYRRKMTAVWVRHALETAAARAGE